MKFFGFFFLIIVFSLDPAFAQKLIILHSNDHHGHFMSAADGNYGLAAQATLVKQVREEARRTGAHVLVLSAGDLNTGPPESVFFKAEPDIRAMNAIGYDAMAIGNHEFDIPLETLKGQEKISEFKFLSANILDKNGKEVFTPYIIKEIDGKKVAIIGLTTPDTAKMIANKNPHGLKFEDPFTYNKELILKLRKENDVLIGLSHLGYFPNESHTVNFPGDETLAKKFPELDFIVGGHTHSELHQPVKVGKTFIVQAKESSHFLGRMDIDISTPSPKVTAYKLLPVRNIPPDDEIKKILQPFIDEGNRRFSEVVGKISPGFEGSRDIIVKSEGPLGNLVAQSQKVYAKADIAIVNGAGVRKGIQPGNVTRRDLMTISPFANTLTIAELDGSEVWKMVKAAKKNFMIPGNRAYFSNNFVIETENDVIKNITLEGKRIPNTPEGKYRVAMNNYISEAVEDFAFFRNHATYTDTGVDVTEALVSYMKQSSVIEASTFKHGTFNSGSCLKQLLHTIQKTSH
ncbi:MAG: 5'-nucleotidase C-terminal domain-containing protein [Bacteriovoracia bacterium]